MGCSGSKADVGKIHESQSASVPKVVKIEAKVDEDPDFEVLKPGKAAPKNQLDEFSHNSSTLNKTTDKGKDINEFKGHTEEPVIAGLHHRESMHLPQEESEDIILPDKERYKKAQTLAEFSRENGTHEFDFSFIDEKPKVDIESDLTDKILKEISEI